MTDKQRLDRAHADTLADEVEGLRAQLDSAKAEVRKLRRRASKHRAIEEAIREAVDTHFEDSPPTLKAYRRAKAPKPKGHEERPQLILTDWQGGKVTQDFDLDVLEERITLVCDKALALVQDRRRSATVNALDVCFLGDQVEGETIFAGQAFEIDSPVIDQVDRVARIQADVLARMLGHFDTVRAFGISGNHGRVAPKGTGGSTKTNWDRVCYRMTDALLRALPEKDRSRLEFEIPDGSWHVHEALGWRILKFHGDQIRGGFAGFPWYGVGRKASGWKDALPGSFDIAMHGHFHTPVMFVQNTSQVYGSGSPESNNEYARSELAAAGDPSQRILFISEAHGVVADHVLWCVDRKPFATRIAETVA